jgi:ElaB/YqjD/DUF883 family membrane-anchored ribosome-binding protein
MSSKISDVSAAGDQLVADFRTMIADAEELLKVTQSISGQGVEAAREKLVRNIQVMRDRIAPAQTYALDKTKAAIDATVTCVRERPWQTLAVVMLVGLVVGVMSTRSSKD